MIAELERTLAPAFGRAQLAIYADALQAIGDPRGLLIATELAGLPVDEELRREWLADIPRGAFVTASLGMLYVTTHREDAIAALLASPYRRAIRSLEVSGGDTLLRTTVDAIAAGPPMPVLTTLRLANRGVEYISTDLATATPALDELELVGPLLRDFQHPTCRVLRFALPVDFEQLDLPAIRTIDVRATDHEYIPVFELLAAAKLPQHSLEILIPAPRHRYEHDMLRKAERDQPMVTFEVPIGDPIRAIAPWPRPSEIDKSHCVGFLVGGHVNHAYGLRSLARQLDHQELASDTRDAWAAFWTFIAEQPPYATTKWLEFPSQVLVTAMRGTTFARGDAWDNLQPTARRFGDGTVRMRQQF